MSNSYFDRSREYIPGLGVIIWIASIMGVVVGFIVYDLNRRNSLIRRLIEVGREKVEGSREPVEVIPVADVDPADTAAEE